MQVRKQQLELDMEQQTGSKYPLGDLPDPGIEPMSPVSPALAGGFFTTNATWEAHPTPPLISE